MMCGKLKEEEEEYYSHQSFHNMQSYQLEQLHLLHQQQQQQQMQQQQIFPQVSPPIIPWSLPPVRSFNPVHDQEPFSLYGDLFNNRSTTPDQALQFGYGGSLSSGSFGLQSQLGKMSSAQQIMDAKALAASRSHSEAERRRRERINNHLAKLRSLLPSSTKTDKASLLAEVIQHVKELKHQTSLIGETSPVPSEVDELTVDTASDEYGKFVIRASLCCEDRPNLLPDLIRALKTLRLRALKAEITTLSGRVRSVLFITGEEEEEYSNNDGQQQEQYSLSSIQEALQAVMERTNGDEQCSCESVKRQRTNVNVFEHRSFLN